MFCIECGFDNLEAAKFCRKCGASFGTEEKTRISRREVLTPTNGSTDDEAKIFSISPTLMFVKAGYIAAAAAAILLAGAISAFTPLPVWVAVVTGLLLFLIPAYYNVRQRLVRYTLTDTKLEIDEGLVSRRTRSIPLRRIQDVMVSSSVIQRMLGYGDLMIDNASDEGGKIVLRNINDPKEYADTLLRQMRRLEK